MRLLLYLAICNLAICTLTSGQTIGQNTLPVESGDVTFTISTQLVVETVSVRDKAGKPLKGLTAKDFNVTENGIERQIRFFEEETLRDSPAEALKGQATEPGTYRELSRAKITPEVPGNSRYKDRRLLALYFDMSALLPLDSDRTLSAAEKFVRTQMQSADLLAVMCYGGGAVNVMQDFTDDRIRLLRVFQAMMAGGGGRAKGDGNCAVGTDTGAAFGQDDPEFNIFNTDRQLAVLQTAVGMLSRITEKKSLIYFSSGIRSSNVDNQAQLSATINSAIRAGVSFWPVDARGLVAEAPQGDATQASPGGIAMYSGKSATTTETALQRSQDTLYALASDTGGKAFLDSNDLSKGLVAAQHALSDYYVIGYYPTEVARDGKFRRVKITLNASLSANLDYRQGYYAEKEFKKFTANDRERQLEEALMLPDPVTQLTIAMEVDYFQLNRAEYFVPVMVKIPGRELALAKRGGAEHTIVDFIGEIKDEFGVTMQNVRDKVSVKLSGSSAAELAKRPIEYETGFTIFPGKYVIKFLARDDETGRIGTYQTSFVIPNLNKEDRRVPISSVVLGSQRVAISDALYNVTKKKPAGDANPLVQDRQKLVPSVTRVFSRSHPVYVYFQAYEQSVAVVEPLIAFVGFYSGQTQVFETKPVQVTERSDNLLRTIRFFIPVSLEKLDPGNYDCQVSVLNNNSQKATFWRAPISVVP